MPTHYTNCLYVHGLHSDVNRDKVKIMEKYFTKVMAEHINYGETPNTYSLLKEMCLTGKVDFIIGSSFGGYLGFYLSRELGLPCLLFNPALFFGDEDDHYLRVKPTKPSPFSLIVQGEKDDVVPANSIGEFLDSNAVDDQIKVIRCDWLPHRIDLVTFETMVMAGIELSRSA